MSRQRSRQVPDAWKRELALAFLVSKNEEEVEKFLVDLLTDEEFERLAFRWQAIRLRLEGLSEREIRARLGASTYLVSRANQRVIKNGTGMAEVVWQRLRDRPKGRRQVGYMRP